MDKYLSARQSTGRYRRPNFPKDLKRRLAEQTFESGASVALIARQNDINANLLFKWRQHYLDGDYGLPTVGAQAGVSAVPPPAFFPAAVVADAPPSTPSERPALPAPVPAPEPGRRTSAYCEVDFGHARLKVLGDVSPALVSTLIVELMRAGAALP